MTIKYMYLLALPIFFLFLAWSNNHVEVQKPIVVTGNLFFKTTKGEFALDSGYVKLSLDKIESERYNCTTNAKGEFSIDIGSKDENYEELYASIFSFSKKEGDKFRMPEKLKFKVSRTFTKIGKRKVWELETTTFTKHETNSKLEINVGNLYIDLTKSN